MWGIVDGWDVRESWIVVYGCVWVLIRDKYRKRSKNIIDIGDICKWVIYACFEDLEYRIN
jgi:hypothetical protein